MRTGTWVPLFEGSAVKPFEQALDTIVDALETHQGPAGDWGPALLHAYLTLARPGSTHRDKAEQLLQRAGESLAIDNYPMSLYAGIAGVGWMCAHVDSLFECREEDSYEEVDDAVIAFLEHPPTFAYDLISGTVGLGVYLLERLPHPKAANGLRKVFDRLKKTAEETREHSKWYTPAHALHKSQLALAPLGYYNLGVAHGAPGVLGLLSEMHKACISRPEVHAMLQRCTRWILEQQQPDGSFPAWIAPGVAPAPSRVAWCYGELGVSLTLLGAARATSDNALEEVALDIARSAARRTDVEHTRDAGLCHGAVGNAHLFNRLFQSTRQPVFRDAAVSWFGLALRMCVDGAGVGGYRAWKPFDVENQPRDPPWDDTADFLMGASGIGLAYLAAITPIEPKWDRVMLSCVAPAPLNLV